ncbi:hypothetical protein [Chryseobacterium takakiae]|uniref:Uncharacterized protein n=1 Tax=Chryseobacterium takakiae TaxID=1302685 RepID=A0A1M4ZYT5_9FLAO|nr:hypothetical protein [Chryseobacterium takakiae]SHF23210.1 hypothetical protein SAMN05444408_11193 [Chryseobacterium takakiae]
MNDIYYFRQIETFSNSVANEIVPLEKCNIIPIDVDNFKFKQFSVPSNILKLLRELVKLYNLEIFSSDFITLLAFTQNTYFNESEHLSIINSMDEDYLNLSKNLSSLFDILEEYLFSNNYNYLKSIYFKNKNGNNLTVDNFFLVQDIYSSIIHYYGFNKDNFSSKRLQILEDESTMQFKNTSEIYKKQFIKQLHSFLIDRDLKKSDSLRFIGVFLHFAQIQSNNKYPVEIYDTLKENIESIDLKNLNNYISR